MGQHRAASPGTGRRPSRPVVLGLLTVAAVASFLVVAPLAAADQDRGAVAGTPCRDDARACVDLAGKKAWLIDDGTVVLGPVPISHGGPGKETPTGTFAVEWKNRDHRSKEFDDAPMPFAVFFAPGGIAFHQGNLTTTSAGCVRLEKADAGRFYDHLQVGDEVQIR